MRYSFCPQCGRKLFEKDALDDGKIPYCEKCGRYWFDTFSSCVIIMVINEENEIALLKQNYMSTQYRNFVSGYMTPGENAESAAIREVKEEIGLELDSLEASGTWWYEEGDMLMHGFIGYVQKQDFILSPEVDNAEWIPIEQAEQYMYPDSPGNAQYGTYKLYMKRLKQKA